MLQRLFFHASFFPSPLHFLLLFFCAGAALSFHAGEDVSPPLTPAAALLDSISGTLKAIQQESPVFFHQMELKMIQDKNALAAEFLTSVSPAITAHPQPETSVVRGNGFFSSHLSRDRILYLEFKHFNQELRPLLEAELKQTIKQKMHLIGIILDLRGCSGGNPQDAQHVFSLLSFDAKRQTILHVPVPILVLTDSGTAGSAEVLAKLLEHTRYGLCIGEKTGGMPFPRKKIRSGEITFYIPVIPEELATLTPDALTPAIKTAVKPRMTHADLSESKPVTEKSDPALSRARDLLLSLDTLNKKWRK